MTLIAIRSRNPRVLVNPPMKTTATLPRVLKFLTSVAGIFLLALASADRAHAQSNTLTGAGAGFSITTGTFNTATGNNALRSDTTGFFNTATGAQACLATSTAPTTRRPASTPC